MTPGAHLAALIEALSLLENSTSPADAHLSAYFRNRRFIGSKDRATIAGRFYRIWRCHARLSWWLTEKKLPPSARLLAAADALLNDHLPFAKIDAFYNGGQYAPASLTPEERKGLQALEGHTLHHPHMPETVALECPTWAEDGLRSSLGDRFADVLRAMQQEATLDMRANTLKTNREEMQHYLQEAGIEATPTPYAPNGLRLKERVTFGKLDALTDGRLAIQDEGSQLVAEIVDATSGMRVMDFCAGAGGKTLALAARMNGKGRILATDILDGRLKKATLRFRQADAHNIATHAIASENDSYLKRHEKAFDRVLVDAPCSGTGTWRRNPDARWRRLGPGLEELLALQEKILNSASRLVKPGGRLIYATCSLLADENSKQVEKFLASHESYKLVPVALFNTPMMQLDPANHGTDGFFGAVMERSA